MRPEVFRLTLPYRALEHEVLLIAVPRGGHIVEIQPLGSGFAIHVVADQGMAERETVRIAVVMDGRPYSGPTLHGTYQDGRLYGYIGHIWVPPHGEVEMQAAYFFEIGRERTGLESNPKEAQTP